MVMPACLWAKGLWEAWGHPQTCRCDQGQAWKREGGVRRSKSATPGLEWSGSLSWSPIHPGGARTTECAEGLCEHTCTQASLWEGARAQGTGVCAPVGAGGEGAVSVAPRLALCRAWASAGQPTAD